MKFILRKFKLSPSKFKLSLSKFLLLAMLAQTAGAQQVTTEKKCAVRADGPLPTELWQLGDSTKHHDVRMNVELPSGHAPAAFVRLIEGKLGAVAAGVLQEWNEESDELPDTLRVRNNAELVAFFDRVVESVDAEALAAAEYMDNPDMASGSVRLDYRLRAEWPGMATFEANIYGYHAGAAHGMGVSFAETYDIATLESFSLAHFADTLSLKRSIYAHLADYFGHPAEEALFGATTPASPDFGRAFPFPQARPYLTAEGVAFVSQPYEIAPFAAGLPLAVVPYAEALGWATVEGRRWIERAMCAPENKD